METRALPGVICVLALAGCGGGGYGGGNDPPANRAPVTQPDAVRTRPGTAVDIAVLANDSDPDGDALTVLQPVAPASGAIELLADNRLRVTPAAGFSGDLNFTYQARDARRVLSLNTNVSVTVGPIARAMLGVSGATSRVIVSGTRPGESAVFLAGGPCGFGPFAILSSDMRTMVG
ncbi:MAG TPA: Ig-like domain-containing protein, partial [Steroidobacteraceae bacterium]|nr:Ig-like domain-containing protein [Steroidobacteraceae bacterium]